LSWSRSRSFTTRMLLFADIVAATHCGNAPAYARGRPRSSMSRKRQRARKRSRDITRLLTSAVPRRRSVSLLEQDGRVAINSVSMQRGYSSRRYPAKRGYGKLPVLHPAPETRPESGTRRLPSWRRLDGVLSETPGES